MQIGLVKMRFQLGCEFADYANKQYCLSLPRIALYPQKSLRISVVPVGEVLVALVIKNPLVRVGEQMLLMMYLRSALYRSRIRFANRPRSSSKRSSCLDVSPRRSFERLEYHFIVRTIRIIPSRFVINSSTGFRKT